MPKLTLILDTRRPLSDGRYPLKWRLADANDTKYIPTDIALRREQFRAPTQLIVGIRTARELNERLDAERSRLSLALMELRTSGKIERMSLREIRDALISDLNSYTATPYSELIKRREEQTKYGSWEIYDRTRKLLEKYDPDIDTRKFEDITPAWLDEFEKWASGFLKINSISIVMRCLRRVFNKAITDGLTDCYPFRQYRIKQQQTEKRSLTIDELATLKNWNLKDDWRQEYRDMFMLIFYLIGINAVDLFSAKPEQLKDGRLKYRRAKTGRLYSIKVEPEAMEIINRYRGKKHLLSPLDRYSIPRDYLSHLNRGLKAIGRQEGKQGKVVEAGMFSEISTYWARHTWATIAYEAGIPVDIIAQALGHSDRNHSVTLIYIRPDQDKVDEANRKVIDYVCSHAPEHVESTSHARQFCLR